MGQLFGQFDPVSHEVSTSTLSCSFLSLVVSESLTQMYLFLEGQTVLCHSS